MFLAGFAKQKINHGEGCTLGGYWGNGKCTGIHDNLFCKVTCISSCAADGTSAKPAEGFGNKGKSLGP